MNGHDQEVPLATCVGGCPGIMVSPPLSRMCSCLRTGLTQGEATLLRQPGADTAVEVLYCAGGLNVISTRRFCAWQVALIEPDIAQNKPNNDDYTDDIENAGHMTIPLL